MKILHNSHSSYHRAPFGASVVCSYVNLSIEISPPPLSISLHVIGIDGSEEVHKATKSELLGEMTKYSFSVTSDKPDIIRYYFSFAYDYRKQYYGNNSDMLGGEGAVYDTIPPTYQITFYKENKLPKEYTSGIIYQIYTDRFFRGSDSRDRIWELFRDENRLGARRFYHIDWNDRPFYPKDEKGHVTHWGFFGGTLKGIEEKLSYLKSLGVSTIYLNPIFEAASNHKYDTADYMKIDPGYGDENSFTSLVSAAREMGISIILDGVFSHTGADSIYFNKQSNYQSVGAFADKDSKYYDWYRFTDYPNKYDCWWGVEDLPNVNELNPDYMHFLFAEGGVIPHWMKLGAKGWRLDVADELPDEFIMSLRKSVKNADKDGIVLGEVWEDASNKISYDIKRQYLLGDELDCTMNYPFRTNIMDFINGKITCEMLVKKMMSLKENYPPFAFYGAMNMISTHDTERIITLLGKEWDTLEGADFTLTPEQYSKAKNKLKMLYAIQFASPGVPSIYYGDEVGVQGMKDPYNRATYPWGKEDKEILEHCRNLSHLRKLYPLLAEGDFIPASFSEETYGIWRVGDGESILMIANRENYHTNVSIYTAQKKEESSSFYVLDLLTSKKYEMEEVSPTEESRVNKSAEGLPPMGKLTLTLPPYGYSLIYLRGQTPHISQKPKGTGLLCHISSLPDANLGMVSAAKQFIDFLVLSAQKHWQILPLNPVDIHGSPYSTCSVFAGNDKLCANLNSPLPLKDAEYLQFVNEEAYWLDDYALYTVLKLINNGSPWQEWQEEHKNPTDKKILSERYSGSVEEVKLRQYEFWKQWKEIRAYAAQKGISIIGDLPIYVSCDSADVWANKELFTLDERGYNKLSAGVPPDYFSEEGQYWGNPLYNTELMAENGYKWWKKRISHALKQYDYIRLDHFRSFAAYYAIPAGKKATDGYWMRGMGKEFFDSLYAEFGSLPIIAEDLGILDSSVYDLIDYTDFLGMDIFQFTGEAMLNMPTPEASKRVFYTGTHDNQTLRSFLADSGRANSKQDVREVIEKLFASSASLVILPIQDVLYLDDSARMNIPGTTQGNWNFKLSKNDIQKDDIDFLFDITKRYRRL